MQKFNLPFKLKKKDLTVTFNLKNKMSADLIEVVKVNTIKGFKHQENLLEVSRYISIKLDQFGGGNWMCLILPAEIEPGLSYSMKMALQINFIKTGIEYVILVVQTNYASS